MAESLRRLVNLGTFSSLQDKLERWLDDYNINTCDQNVSRCCEIIELNSRVQSQLFKLLGITSSEGGTYGGATVIKSRLLPWLSNGFYASPGVSSDTSLRILSESASKDREITDIQDMYENELRSLEEDLAQTKEHANELSAELSETKDELDVTKRASVSDKMFTESEVSDMKTKLRVMEDELARTRSRSGLVDQYEQQIRNLRDDIAILTGRRDTMLNGDIGPKETYYRSLPRPTSPLALDDVTQRVRQQNVITRFNDMFVQDRLDSMDTLRRYSDDHDNNQRILFATVQEAFSVAKMAFSAFKMKVRSNLALTHTGPETLEEAVQDYVNRNTDLYDLPGMVSDVVRALNRNPRLNLSPEVSFNIIQPFIREACKLSWNASALAFPLSVTVASDAELFDDNRYRRSYDSEYTAPLVAHHIWPCLVQGSRVTVKGEACTRRGASMSPRSRSPVRSLSPSRALSPSRSYSPSRSPSRMRSRSPSPKRAGSALDSARSSGRASRISRASSRPMTSSTSLSHYGVTS